MDKKGLEQKLYSLKFQIKGMKADIETKKRILAEMKANALETAMKLKRYALSKQEVKKDE